MVSRLQISFKYLLNIIFNRSCFYIYLEHLEMQLFTIKRQVQLLKSIKEIEAFRHKDFGGACSW